MVVIIMPNPPSLVLNLISRFKLRIKKRRQKIRWQVTRPQVQPRVLIHLPAKEAAAVGSFLSNDLGAIEVSRIVDDQRAAFATGEILGLVKALSRQAAEGTQIFAAVLAEQTVRVILHHRDAVLPSHLHNGIHVTADAGVMNYDNRFSTRRDETLELRLIQIERVRPNIYEDGASAAQHESVSG